MILIPKFCIIKERSDGFKEADEITASSESAAIKKYVGKNERLVNIYKI